MQQADILISPRWLIPIEPHGEIWTDKTLVVKNGSIHDILDKEKAKELYHAEEVIELKDHALLPGFINAHTHSPMSLLRGIADDLALMDWLNNHIWPAERQWMGSEFAYEGTQLAILEMLRSGVTCFNEHYFYSHDIARAVTDTKVRAVIGALVINFSSKYASNGDEYLQKFTDILSEWRDHPLIQVCLAPHAPYTVNNNIFTKVKNLATQYNCRIHLHLHETAHEIEQSLIEYKKRPLKRIYELGLVDSNLQCVHMTQINDEDLAILQETKAHIIHCPESNLKLASGFCPVDKLMKHGINIAIGTDGAASNNDLDLLHEVRTAAQLAKAVAQKSTALDAASALRMATLNGAKAIGLEHKIGSLEKNKSADMIAINLNALNTLPIFNPISQIVYAANSRQISDVWVAGKRLLKNGEFTTLDQEAILAKAKIWQDRIFSSAK